MERANPTVAVVLLNYNGSHLLQTYLPSVLEHSSRAEVWVIDNGSTDDSMSILNKYSDEIRVVELERNYGFAGGYNHGLADICADIYVLLNTDLRVTEGWLEGLMTCFDDESVGAAVPKILSDQQPAHFEYAGAAGGYMDRLGYAYCRGRVFDVIEVDHGQYDDGVDIHWGGGCALAVRSSLFHGLGGFDDRFFAHYEEIDLCWRIRRCGYTIRYTSASTVHHLGGGTMSYASPRKLMLNFRNSLFMLFKNLPGLQVVPTLFARMVLDGVAALVFLFEGKFHSIAAVLKAHFGFYGHLPYLINARKRTRQQIAKITNEQPGTVGLSGPLLIWAFFIRRQRTFDAMSYHKKPQ